MYFDAVWSTACEVYVRRAGTVPAAKASFFLSNIDTEAVLQLGLLADAGFECLKLTRFYDSDGYDLADVSEMLSEFVHRIDLLFVQGTALGGEGGGSMLG